MAGRDEYAAANELVVDEQFEEALPHYNAAIEKEPDNAAYLVKRAACYLKLQKYTKAVADANSAIALAPQLPMARMRKGVACFHLDEYESALEAFKAGQGLEKEGSSAWKSYSTWIRKCEAELNDDDEDDDEEDGQQTQTLPAAAASSTASAVSASSTAAASSNSGAAGTSTAAAMAAAGHSESKGELAPLPGFDRIKHEWYQTPTHVIITIFAKKVAKEDAHISISPNAVEVELKLAGGREFQLDLDLYDQISVEASTTRVIPVKVEIKLKKVRENVKWPTLERSEAGAVAWADTSAVDKSVYPSSSKKGPKNWDKLAEQEEEEKLEGDAALNKVFQDIFAKGSDEQRRAMMKSFVESGGTVLSTNWEDVGKRTVEGTPPKGLEMHKWSDLEKGE